MANRILDLVVLNHRLDPHETELRVHVKTERFTPATEVRGRLTGPRCLYSSTIEIAYPLREVSRDGHIEMRAVIPEASWWEPETPFLYVGPLELWQDGALCERIEIRHGIRSLQLTARGLVLNGKPLTLRGEIHSPTWIKSHARQLRSRGANACFTCLAGPSLEPWISADRLGFFVLGAAGDHATFLACRTELTNHPSHFGWVFNRAGLAETPPQQEGVAMFYGVNTSAGNRPANADFIVCNENELAWLDDPQMPKIVIVKCLPNPLPDRADVIGWIGSSTD